MPLDSRAGRRPGVALYSPPWRAHGCVEVVVLAISSAVGCPTRIVSLLTLVLVLTGCQGITRGVRVRQSRKEPYPRIRLLSPSVM